MKTVRFLRAYRIWNQGEAAGFDETEADRLIGLGLAVDPVAEAQAKADAEAQAKADAEAQAKADAEAQAKVDAEAQAKADAEAQAKADAEAQAKGKVKQ